MLEVANNSENHQPNHKTLHHVPYYLFMKHERVGLTVYKYPPPFKEDIRLREQDCIE